MDVGGSFLELACVRIALIPAGPPIADNRFDELSAHLTSFREVPVNALPRRAPLSRPTGSASFHSTSSSMNLAMREALTDPTKQLARSHSAVRDTSQASRPPAYPPFNSSRNVTDLKQYQRTVAPQAASRSDPTLVSSLVSPRTATPPSSPRFHAELNLSGPDVDSSFRMRYEVIYRDHTGALLMRPSSEWDEFHSTKVWGVFGIVDCAAVVDAPDSKSREQIVAEAADDFRTTLTHFRQAAVRRLIVFVHSDAQHNGPFVLNDVASIKDSPSSVSFSVGYIPERDEPKETRLEARAQVIHFAGLLLNEIDMECWRRRQSRPAELLLSPIDENLTADRQPKVLKRQAGRLDKLIGDSLLLMGSPAEALLKYSSAMERSKASSDRLWLAGAMEGWSAAHVLAHVGSGGNANDKALTDRLIDHYAEIYKLYQKKRVAEPEAAAAMRLAEFLSRWTSRRKEALDAAQHAATVGEGLRAMKRAVLWEALARFSDRMRCRRKAALYLFRLGQLNAGQGVLSSAVTLMIAAERQLCTRGQKPWASLNRRVLLTAARHAEEAGDLNTAAKLYVEALVSLPSGLDEVGDSDLAILKSLAKAQVPAYLPAAANVLELEEVVACQIPGLSIRRKSDDEETQKAKKKDISNGGPFIYNPFEAKKRAKAAADAKRTATWVCDEAASVRVRFTSHIGAELIADVIAVLFNNSESDDKKAIDKRQAMCDERNGDDCPVGDELLDSVSSFEDDSQTNLYAQFVREILERSTELAHTIPESITVQPYDRFGGQKHITVLPRHAGPLNIEGVLVRLFDGALVIFRCLRVENAAEIEPPIKVMDRLPKLSLSARCGEGGFDDDVAGRTSIDVYHGERRWIWIEIRNCGTEDILWMKGRVTCKEGSLIEITSDELSGEHTKVGLESPGDSRTFRIGILSRWSRKLPNRTKHKLGDLSFVSVFVEYEGSSSLGTIRESTAQIRVTCRPAVDVGRLTLFERCGEVGSMEATIRSGICVAVEVRNHVSVPARILVVERHITNSNDTAETLCSEENLVEHGACARLVCDMSKNMLQRLHDAVCGEWRHVAHSAEHAAAIELQVRWNLPAMGREGVVNVAPNDIQQAVIRAIRAWDATAPGLERPLITGGHGQSVGVHADLHISLEQTALTKLNVDACPDEVVSIGRYTSVRIDVRNWCEVALPASCSLDVEVMQRDDEIVSHRLRHVYLVGVTQNILVGVLEGSGGKFSHEVKVRVVTTGSFEIVAYLYIPDETKRDSGNDVNIDNTDIRVKKLQRAQDATVDDHNILAEPIANINNGATNYGNRNETVGDVNIIYPQTDPISPNYSRQGRNRLLACSVLRFSGVCNEIRMIDQ